MAMFLGPHWVFCGPMHHKVQQRLGATETICLPDFQRDPAEAFVVVAVA